MSLWAKEYGCVRKESTWQNHHPIIKAPAIKWTRFSSAIRGRRFLSSCFWSVPLPAPPLWAPAAEQEGGIYQFKRCDGLSLCKLIVSPGGSSALREGVGARRLSGRVCGTQAHSAVWVSERNMLPNISYRAHKACCVRAGATAGHEPSRWFNRTEKRPQELLPFPDLRDFQLFLKLVFQRITVASNLPGSGAWDFPSDLSQPPLLASTFCPQQKKGPLVLGLTSSKFLNSELLSSTDSS